MMHKYPPDWRVPKQAFWVSLDILSATEELTDEQNGSIFKAIALYQCENNHDFEDIAKTCELDKSARLIFRCFFYDFEFQRAKFSK